MNARCQNCRWWLRDFGSRWTAPDAWCARRAPSQPNGWAVTVPRWVCGDHEPMTPEQVQQDGPEPVEVVR